MDSLISGREKRKLLVWNNRNVNLEFLLFLYFVEHPKYRKQIWTLFNIWRKISCILLKEIDFPPHELDWGYVTSSPNDAIQTLST